MDETADSFFADRPRSFWMWLVLFALLLVLWLSMLVGAFLERDQQGKTAIASGQRVIVTLKSIAVATPEVKKPVATKPEVKKPTVVAKPEPAKPTPTETPAEGAPDETADNPFAKEIPAYPRGNMSLAIAPNPALVEKLDEISVPRIADDDTVPWRFYGKTVTTTNRPKVAIIVTELGLSNPITQAAIKLPDRFTLSFSPYAKGTVLWALNARNLGFEVLADLPMEPGDYPASDPGPHAILSAMTNEENIIRMNWNLSRFAGFVGVLGPADENLTQSPLLLKPLIEELTKRGILFLYVKDSTNVELLPMLKESALLGNGVDKILDKSLTEDQLKKSLAELVAQAKAQGSAIGTARAYPITIDTLKAWAGTLESQGVELVPVSTLFK